MTEITKEKKIRRRLWELCEKEHCTIESIDSELKQEFIDRLLEIGLDKGGEVICIKKLPFKGPKIFQINDSVFSLEEDIANKVIVKKVIVDKIL